LDPHFGSNHNLLFTAFDLDQVFGPGQGEILGRAVVEQGTADKGNGIRVTNSDAKQVYWRLRENLSVIFET